jgi:glutamate N-acetyltransferase/amino-acid N-acetyltransferase
MTQPKVGVCAPKGFLAAGVQAGFKKGKTQKDLALIYSRAPCRGVAVYTTNAVKGAPLLVTRKHLEGGWCQALICNSGNANTCTANGMVVAENTCQLLGEALGIDSDHVAVASTGVIGVPLLEEPFHRGIPLLVKELSEAGGPLAAQAILTTDRVTKEASRKLDLEGGSVVIGGMAKGSGMIHPNMATMLCFLTTDAEMEPALMEQCLQNAVKDSFNQISVDGDTSTNDMVLFMANGASGCGLLEEGSSDYLVFQQGLIQVCQELAQMIAADGEGATKQITCQVVGAVTKEAANGMAKSVVSSTLVKAAVFGADANWGRVLCALGYSGEILDPTHISVWFSSSKGRVKVCEKGVTYPFSEEWAKEILEEDSIRILVELEEGVEEGKAWGCDLTYDYVRINGDYRS